MHYAVLTADNEHEVAVDECRPNVFSIALDGRTYEVEAHELADGQMQLRFGGRQFTVELDALRAWVGDGFVEGEVVDLRALALRRAQQAARDEDGSVEVTAPMAGKVAAVLVAEGQEVQQGDGLLVIEAMKMENELRAPKPGVVRGLSSRQGSVVDLGATLCRVE